MLLGWLALPGRTWSEELMPEPRYASFLARALVYDGNLKERAGVSIAIAVLYSRSDGDSTRSAEHMAAALKTLELTKILDLPVTTHLFEVDTAEALEKAVLTHGIDAFVVCPCLEKKRQLIKSVSEKRKVITFGVTSAQVRAGLSIAVYQEDGKSKILVNLPASRTEGAAFTGDLLRLSEVIR